MDASVPIDIEVEKFKAYHYAVEEHEEFHNTALDADRESIVRRDDKDTQNGELNL